MTVDTVAYVDPTSPDTSGTPVAPQRTSLSQLTFEGDDAGSECGLAILQGMDFRLDRLSFRKTKIALWMKDVWMTEITGLSAWGQIRHEGGTSTTYKNCFAKVIEPTVNHGAFRISNLTYSNLISCASDGTLNTAYWFDNCDAVNVIGCGCEVPSAPPGGYGAAISIINSCNMVFDSFRCIPKPSETQPLVAVFADNSIVFNNLCNATSGTYGWDLFVHGTGNIITFNGGKFNTGEIPKVGVSAAAVGSKIIVNTSSNKFIHVVSEGNNSVIFEPFSEYLSIDSKVAVTFGSTTTGVTTVAKDVKYRKEGGLVTVEFYLEFNGSPGQTGVLLMRNLPYVAKNIASGTVSVTRDLPSSRGQFTVTIDRGSNSLQFFKFSNPTCTAVNETDITSTTAIRGSITYTVNSQFY